MAAPTLDPIPEIVTTPGSTVTVRLVGRDADARTYTGEALLHDSQGNEARVAVTMVVEDPLTYSLTMPDPLVVAGTAEPGVFQVTIP